MKKIKFAALLLALIMIIGTAVGCQSKAAAVMTFKNNVIDENEYCYMLSNYKAVYLYNLFGLTADNQEIWTSKLSEDVTVNDYLTALANSTVLQTVLCLGLFDEYGLSLSDAEIANIEVQMQNYITAAGSKSALNKMLSAYGANADTMKSIVIDSLKVAKLRSYLYGENGISVATDEEKDTYYKENYMCAKLIFISSQKEYEFDENGNCILDEKTGVYKTRDLTEEEKAAKKALFDSVEARVNAGEDFDSLMRAYTMNLDMANYEDGYYFTSNSSFLEQTVISTVSEMEIGTVKSLTTDSGWYIIKRCELRDKAYDDDKYKGLMFSDMVDTVHSAKLQKLIEPYVDEVVMDKDIMEKYQIAYCTPNFSILTGQITD